MIKTQIVGNLTRDPVQRELGGKPCCSMNVAAPTRYKEKGSEEYLTNFIDVLAFFKADYLCRSLHKGDQVTVAGDMYFRTYKDKDGVERHSIGVNNAEVIIGRQRNGDSGQNETRPDQSRSSAAPASASAPASNDDDELPF